MIKLAFAIFNSALALYHFYKMTTARHQDDLNNVVYHGFATVIFILLVLLN